MQGVSVIICSYNSASRIQETLRYLSLQKTKPYLLWEIVLVDNASTDNTEQVALNYWKTLKSSIKLFIVKEPRPGLSHARKTGINHSSYDVIVFCDDDNWLSDSYLQIAFEVMQQDEKIGAAGGEGIAKSNVPLPDWFEEYKVYFACFPQAEKSGELTTPSAFLYGAGLVVRKQIVLKIYSRVKFLTSDRLGEKLVSGGDNELCYLLKLIGYKLWYDDRLKFCHFLPSQRLSENYLRNLISTMSLSSKTIIMYQYILLDKKVDGLTWLRDVLYRSRSLGFTLFHALFEKNRLRKKIIMVSDWYGLIGVLNQFGRYKKNKDRILSAIKF
jgi:glycosyltransferase involved in cell wall biosynthesis